MTDDPELRAIMAAFTPYQNDAFGVIMDEMFDLAEEEHAVGPLTLDEAIAKAQQPDDPRWAALEARLAALGIA